MKRDLKNCVLILSITGHYLQESLEGFFTSFQTNHHSSTTLLPPTLIIRLDRVTGSQNEMTLNSSDGGDTQFYFPVHYCLDLSSYVSGEALYHFTGVVSHFDDDTNSGMYIRTIREAGHYWTLITDSRCQQLPTFWSYLYAYAISNHGKCFNRYYLVYELNTAELARSIQTLTCDPFTPYQAHSLGASSEVQAESTLSPDPIQTPPPQLSPDEKSEIGQLLDLISNSHQSLTPSAMSSLKHLRVNTDSSESHTSDFLSPESSSELFSDDFTSESPTTASSSPIPGTSALMLTETLFAQTRIETETPASQNGPLPKVLLHVDNAPSHNSAVTSKFLLDLPFIRLPHPPYSFVLAPCDFFLFGYIKERLSKRAVHRSDIRTVVRNLILEIPKDMFIKVFDH